MTYFQEKGSCDVAYLIMPNGSKATGFKVYECSMLNRWLLVQ